MIENDGEVGSKSVAWIAWQHVLLDGGWVGTEFDEDDRESEEAGVSGDGGVAV